MTLTKNIQEKSINIMYKIKKPLFLAVFCMFYVKKEQMNYLPLWQQTQFSIRVALGCKVALKCNPKSLCNRPTNWNL